MHWTTHITSPYSVYTCSHRINADITADVPMIGRLQLSKGECEEVFQRKEGEIQSRVQLCPAVLSSQDQLCGHVTPVLCKQEERERNEAVTHRRSSSASRSGWEHRAVWSEALGGRPKHCMEKAVLNNWEFTAAACVTHRPKRESWQPLHRGLEIERNWNSE